MDQNRYLSYTSKLFCPTLFLIIPLAFPFSSEKSLKRSLDLFLLRI